MDIFYAVEGDVDWLLQELEEFAKFAGTHFSLFPTEDEVRREILRALIKDHLFLVALREDGERLGFTAGLINPHILNPKILVCQEIFWWVPPRHRGSSAGLRLLDAFIKESKELDAEWIFWSMQHHTPASDRVLLKRGFRLQEKYYLLEVTDAVGNLSRGVHRRSGTSRETSGGGEEASRPAEGISEAEGGETASGFHGNGGGSGETPAQGCSSP